MPVYADAAIDHLVKIDANHADFVRALVTCHKPRRILELGFGAGEATRAILSGLAYNRQDFTYTVVDNWLDFGGRAPAAISDPAYGAVGFVTSGECQFVQRCRAEQLQFDFVFSDADHHHTQDWFDIVYADVLAPGGVLLYHDVTNSRDFPNLRRILDDVRRQGIHHLLLDRCSVPGERCDRGLLAIFKR